MSEAPAYRDYWRRRELLQTSTPTFPLRRWWPTDRLCEIESVYFEAVRDAASILDIGAGDLRMQEKFRAEGFKGDYDTQDIGREFSYTYEHLEEIKRKYDAVLCLDVIEHLPLNDGLSLLDKLMRLLEPGGILVVQTPNARCIRSPLSWDVTHVHLYNLGDLWAYLTAAGLDTVGYRVVFSEVRLTAGSWLRRTLGAFVTTRLLGSDYADNVVVIGRMPGDEPTAQA